MSRLILATLVASVAVLIVGAAFAQQPTSREREIYRGRVECEASAIARQHGKAAAPRLSRHHVESCQARKVSHVRVARPLGGERFDTVLGSYSENGGSGTRPAQAEPGRSGAAAFQFTSTGVRVVG
jgi:hypothetical protein